MNRHVLLLPGPLLRVWLAVAAVAAFCVPVLLCPASAAQGLAQNQIQQATIKLPEFGGATVRYSQPNPKPQKPGIFAVPGGEVRAQSLTLGALMWYAFDVQPFQIVGGPQWIHKDLFDVIASPPATAQPTRFSPVSATSPLSEEQRLMLQSLLIARFQLAFHREFKTGQVFILEKAKHTKLHSPRKEGEPGWVGSNVGTAINGDGLAGKNASMPLLALRLSRYLQCPVIDKTGLKEKYDFRYEYANNNPNTEEALVNSIVTAVDEIGLMLEPSTGPVDTIVVDNAEKPPAN